MLNNLKKYIVPIILLVVLIVISILVSFNIFDSFDKMIMNHIYDIRGNKYNVIFWISRILTEMGYYYFIIGLLILVGIYFKFRKRIWVLAGTVLANLGINSLIKIIIRRPRPLNTEMWMKESSYSFPSGHTATSVCLYLLLFLIAYKTIDNKIIRRILMTLSIFAIIIVPITRLIMGVHYPTDVLGGILMGSSSALISYNIFFNKEEVKE